MGRRDNAPPPEGWVCPSKPWDEACCCETPQHSALIHGTDLRLADHTYDGLGDN